MAARRTDLDRVFAALASPARRVMLDLLSARPGITIAELSREGARNPGKTRVRMSGVGVLKHVRVLERAGLVVSQREGRVRRLYFNPVPIQLIYDRWTDQYQGFWSARLADIKERLELGARASGAPAPGATTGTPGDIGGATGEPDSPQNGLGLGGLEKHDLSAASVIGAAVTPQREPDLSSTEQQRKVARSA